MKIPPFTPSPTPAPPDAETCKRTRCFFSRGAAIAACAVVLVLAAALGLWYFQAFFFLPANTASLCATPSAAMLPPDGEEVPLWSAQPHLESTAPAAGETAATSSLLHTNGGDTPARLPDAENASVRLPASIAGDAAAAAGILREAGLAVGAVLCRSPLPAGQVAYLSYCGVKTDDGYAVVPGSKVTLYVSGKKPVTPPKTADTTVYLTFDDGPSAYTEQILDILGLHGARATFFTLGTALEEYPDAAVRAVREGHVVGSHGYSHRYGEIYQSADALLDDVRLWKKTAEQWSLLPGTPDGFLPFRFPGGSVSRFFDAAQRTEMTAGLHEMGFSVYDWNILTGDGVLSDCPEDMDIYDYLKSQLDETWKMRESSAVKIILMHDIYPETVRLLPWVLHYVLEKGYTFGTLDELGAEFFLGEGEGTA